MEKILFIVMIAMVTEWLQTVEGQCIETAWPNDFESVFNKLNKPECISLRSTPKEVNVIPLTVKRACVRYKQLEILSSFSGRANCSELELLYVPYAGDSSCPLYKECKSDTYTATADDGTICMTRCPKVASHGDYFELMMVTGLQSLKLCGIQTQAGYFSFENITGITFHGYGNAPVIVPGKIGLGIQTNRNLNQWVDLGNVSPFTCMTLPENCGPDGGALSAWIKLIDCPSNAGFIGSRTGSLTGLKTQCLSTGIGAGDCPFQTEPTLTTAGACGEVTSYDAGCQEVGSCITTELPRGYYSVYASKKTNQWFYMEWRYHGEGRGMSVYHDGYLEGSTASLRSSSRVRSSSRGNFVIGRIYTDRSTQYASVLIEYEIYLLCECKKTPAEVKLYIGFF